jgi:hypothetical protein
MHYKNIFEIQIYGLLSKKNRSTVKISICFNFNKKIHQLANFKNFRVIKAKKQA